MGHRQKGKNKKRRKAWHRGGVEARHYKRSVSRLGDTIDPTIDYTQAVPQPINRSTKKSQLRNNG